MIELIPPSPEARNYRHGYKTAGKYASEYAIWSNIRARCRNQNNPNYAKYGARGIRVCARWEADFINFLEDMGRRPSADHSIDRIDNSGDYTPENCRWATRKEQCRNRRSSKFLVFRGEEKTAAEWSEICGVSQGTLYQRLKSGWSVEDALSKPVRGFASKDGKTPKPATIFKHLPF